MEGRSLLRKKELVEAVGMAKSTVADWVAEFQAFIPIVKEGAVTLYKPESVDVLIAIKAMREQNLPKGEIYAVLQQRGFPVTVQEAVEDVQKALGRVDARKQLMDVMQQVGTALERIADQEETLEHMEKRQDALSERQNGQDGRMTELEQMVIKMKAELDAARSEIATTKLDLQNSKKRSWWSFGR